MLHAVIMAGGSGTRFWPASRVDYPKQLLKMVGNETMLQSTFTRLAGLVSAQHVLIMTNNQLVGPVREQLPDVPPEQVIGEPMKRDTAACIGLAASLITNADPNGVMLVLPADHVIKTQQQFQDCMRSGMKLIEQSPDRIVTFGIRPTYPPNRLATSSVVSISKMRKPARRLRSPRSGKSRIATRRNSTCKPVPTTGTVEYSCGGRRRFWTRYVSLNRP